LIGPDGDQLGIKPVPDALRMARGLELDLVEVAPMANPPVCRIMDYGKFRYEEAQKAKESRKKSTNVSVKEVKFRPKIGRGDFDVKVRKVDQFIHEGHKVKVTLQFRGREMAHPELGTKILDQVLAVVGSYVKVETQARLEGRNMSMVLSPDKQALDLRKAAGLAPPPVPEGELEDDSDEHDDDHDEHDEQDASTDSVEVTEPVAADVAEQAAP
jgi:translation initiation factor IF-3